MFKTIDLFAGAGGLSYGFMQTGKFKLVAAAEIDKNAQATYKKNIAPNDSSFVMIGDVKGYDFAELSNKLGGIDVVIGGPPCQGFSNANRQKNHLISMNNALVKEYFRAIKEIRPKAFVMENVSMLSSDVHRFYESEIDNDVIEELIHKGFSIPKRVDTILISESNFDEVDLYECAKNQARLKKATIPEGLVQLLSVLNKNINNEKRLERYLLKNSKVIVNKIADYCDSVDSENDVQKLISNKLIAISKFLNNEAECSEIENNLKYIVYLQKAISTINEIWDNQLIGNFSLNLNNELLYTVNSYSVIDYVNAILGGDYMQTGSTLKAEWFGVPQERRRYFVIGLRKDVATDKPLPVISEPKEYKCVTVGDAILDLCDYEAGYDKEYVPQTYNEDQNLSEYATMMREGSTSVKNHITTSTRPTAMARFKAIEQGKNFHSLSTDMKSTYAKPERTQNTIYLRLDPTKPSGTVVNVRKSMWIHPDLDRAVTVREAARLQSFPDKFEFLGTKDSQYQQVGNAVPPLLAKGVAEKVLEYL